MTEKEQEDRTKDNDELKDTMFRSIWERFAVDGLCDLPNSVEHKRVYQAWVNAGRPIKIATFIVEHANAHLSI